MSDSGRFEVTLLGTGGPTPDLERAQPAAVVRCGDELTLVDCGDAAMTQLVRAGFDPARVTTLLFTHLHWDHVLGYPGFVWGSWSLQRRTLHVVGPPGTRALHDHLLREPFGPQAQWAQSIVGWDPAGWEAIDVEEVGHGHTLTLGGARVRFGTVVHPPMESYGIRFEYDGRSLVLSGDTARCTELVELSAGANVVVVDACASASAPYDDPRGRALLDTLRGFHANARDAGDMAAAAGVDRLILTHLLPGAEPGRVAADARESFDGDVRVGADLQTYVV